MTQRTAYVSSGYVAKDLLPDDAYPGTLVKVEETVVPEGNFSGKIKPAGPGFYLTYAVKDAATEEFYFLRKRVRESFYDEKGKESALVAALRAMGIVPPKNGESYDDDDWIGAGCLVIVDSYDGTDGNRHNSIKSLSQLPSVLKRTMAAEAAEAAEAFALYDAEWEARRAQRATAGSQPDF